MAINFAKKSHKMSRNLVFIVRIEKLNSTDEIMEIMKVLGNSTLVARSTQHQKMVIMNYLPLLSFFLT